MKYLYQQLLAFWVVIIIILLIIGSSFTVFTRQTMLNNTYEQLNGYAENLFNLGDDNTKNEDQIVVRLDLGESILNTQGVAFTYIQSDGSVSYPADASSDIIQYVLTDGDWEKLSTGEESYLTYTLKTNPAGNKVNTAYVLRRVEKGGEFHGVLAISQPINAIDKSMMALMDNMKKAFLISSIVAIIISYVIARFQLVRINKLRSATRQIASGNFDVDLESKHKDEFDDLAEDFNSMAGALKESHAEVERQEERRKKFMADAAHEMRTPLTTINGLLEGITHHAIPENQQENALKLMQSETSRLIRLVNENLDYEKIRTNQISIVVKKFSATKTLAELIQQMQNKADTAGDQLILATKEDIEVYADYDRFMQIMVNIIQNAIQFTKDGTITIEIEKGYLETIIRISDTGMGISEEDLRNIWDRYYKVDPSRTSTKYGESGLGLSIVQQLVKLHKGRVDVESQVGKGTTFVVSFPDVEITEENKV